MHSTKRENGRIGIGMVKLSAVLLGSLLLAASASAHDTLRQHEHSSALRGFEKTSSARDAQRVDRRLDRRGAIINHHYDFFAFVAAFAGDYALADALDRRGDRIERYYDRKGDRIVRRSRLDAHRHHARCGHARIDHRDKRRHGRHGDSLRGHDRSHKRSRGGHRDHRSH